MPDNNDLETDNESLTPFESYGNRAQREREAYKLVPAGTHIVTTELNGNIVELGPTNVQTIYEATVAAASEFIERQDEGVTVVIPMMGGIPLADSLIRRLGRRGYDLSKIDLRFAKKVKAENIQNKDEYILDDDVTPAKKAKVMIDDIVDSTDAYTQISKKLGGENRNGKLICFTPVIKTEGNGTSSTVELAHGNGHSIAQITPGQMEYADINYHSVIANEWVDNAFGMNSGRADDLSALANSGSFTNLQLKRAIVEGATGMPYSANEQFLGLLAEMQTLERLSPVCLAGAPVDIVEYIKYLKNLASFYTIDESPLMKPLYEIELVHFVSINSDSREQALQKMGMAREYFELVLRNDFAFQMLKEDWAN